ncbi:hypothetical protein SDC9_96022 [bioreactor metagenome]|uniref:Uncharacterized protein n=1 Tax=bioreactor metagenome TaxID=1076179 RepID=A0A645AEM1_9ZZZZ
MQKHPKEQIAHLAHPAAFDGLEPPVYDREPLFVRGVFVRPAHEPPKRKDLVWPNDDLI